MPALGSKEFIAGMVFNVKTSAHVYESNESDCYIEEYRIDQIWNAVCQVKPSWGVTRAVHVVGADFFGFVPVTKDTDGREYFSINIKGNILDVYAPDLIIPVGE